jgi:hypothetical protein
MNTLVTSACSPPADTLFCPPRKADNTCLPLALFKGATFKHNHSSSRAASSSTVVAGARQV